jgi:hypothetical protein
MLCIIVSFFDGHIETITGIKRLPLPELALLFFVSIFIVKNELLKNTLNHHVLIPLLLVLLAFISGLISSYGTILASIGGIIWVYKPLFAFLLGWSINLEKDYAKKALRFLFYISIISAIFTLLQFFYGPLNPFFYGRINPFGFHLSSSGIVGFMDNPNKNGFILLFGFLYSTFTKNKYKSFYQLIFIISILFVQSRQVLIALLLLLIYEYIIRRKNYNILLYMLLGMSVLFYFFQETLFSRFKEFDKILETGNYFRLKAILIGFEVLKSNLLFGTGPGTFGGIIAHLTDSLVHVEYKLFDHWKYYRNLSKVPVTIDMYWPHLIVEVGLIGTSVNFIFYRLIYKSLKIKKTNSSKGFLRLLFLTVIFMSFFSMALEASYIAIPIFLILGIELKNKINEENI